MHVSFRFGYWWWRAERRTLFFNRLSLSWLRSFCHRLAEKCHELSIARIEIHRQPLSKSKFQMSPPLRRLPAPPSFPSLYPARIEEDKDVLVFSEPRIGAQFLLSNQLMRGLSLVLDDLLRRKSAVSRCWVCLRKNPYSDVVQLHVCGFGCW